MVQPLHEYFVIDREEVKESKGGIILPNKKPTQRATILAVPESNGTDIEVGNVVIINQYAPLELDNDGETITIIAHEDIYCIVEA